MNRKLTIKLSRDAGIINMFYAFLNGKRIIASEGTEIGTWTGQIEDGEVRLKVRVTGIDSASYIVSIDLPGTANDQELTFQLNGGYHEFAICL